MIDKHMTISIDQIAAIASRGLSRSNQFSVQGFPGGSTVDDLICSAPSPGSSYSTFIWKNSGPGIPLPYEFLVDGMQFSFYDDSNKTASNALYGWHRSVMTEDYKFNFLSDYARDITVNEHDNVTGAITQSRKLINAWCSNYNTVEMSMEAMNTLKKIDITVMCERIE